MYEETVSLTERVVRINAWMLTFQCFTAGTQYTIWVLLILFLHGFFLIG